jgi:hypothetical protein
VSTIFEPADSWRGARKINFLNWIEYVIDGQLLLLRQSRCVNYKQKTEKDNINSTLIHFFAPRINLESLEIRVAVRDTQLDHPLAC